MKNPNATTSKAFTLIELMVSVALFSVVVTIVSAAYLNLLTLDRQAHATNDIATNLSFVVDTMSRSIRTGNSYQCENSFGTFTSNCPYPNGQPGISFINDQGQLTVFEFSTSGRGQIGECTTIAPCMPGSNPTYTEITNPNITISSVVFYVQGVGNTDGIQPQVTFVIKGQINGDPNHGPIPFDIESGATDRVIDI